MDDISTYTESLLAHIQQLENENNELRKYVEQLCTQQAGPRYLHVANGMHFQKTAGLEQEVKKLRKELAESKREISNLKEELSEASNIKMKFHEVEAQKRKEIENQLKFFQKGIVADIADHDKAFAEATIAKEKEHLMSQTLHECQERLEEMKSDAMKAQEHVTMLQIDLAEKDRQNVLFKKVVDKFDQIRKQCLLDWEDENALQEECRSLNELVENLQSKIQMGSKNENDLKTMVCNLQNKMKMSDEFIDNEISRLRRYYTEQRNDIADLLDEGNSHLISLVHESVESLQQSTRNEGLPSLQQNVSALMQLQELEDRHLQERNGNAVLLDKLSELQRSFEQVKAEKLEALMKLESSERELLSEKTTDDGRAAKLPANDRCREITSIVKEGRFANLLKRASSARLTGAAGFDGLDSSFHSVSGGYSNSMVVPRMKIEITILNESLRNLEDLTSGIHKLRVSLVKAMNDNANDSLMRSIEHIINEANIVQTSLCSSIPVSWADEGDIASSSHGLVDERGKAEDSRQVKIKSVSAAGFEMVELLLLAAQIVKDKATERRNQDKRLLKVQ